MSNIYQKFLELQKPAAGLVLATVTGSTGSTPQKPGSSAIFQDGKLISGTIGGGVTEGRIQAVARETGTSRKSRYVRLNLNSDISEKEEAICGGEICILVDADPALHLPVFNEAIESLQRKEPGVLLTMITKYHDDHVLVNRYWATLRKIPSIPGPFLEKLKPEIKRLLSSSSTDTYSSMDLAVPGEEPSSTFFLEVLMTPPRMIIAGAGHIGRALSHLGRILDFEVTVIDDRRDFANTANLPDADKIIVKDIGQAMSEIEKNSDTFIVIVTRGHNDDSKALKPCIGSGSAYVGMIGSRMKVARMKADFLERKWATEEQWEKLFTPIGLEIKSRTVDEIALSIAAQIIMVKNRGIKK